METYQVIVTLDAEDDLKELRDYIAFVLLVPDTARSYLRTLRKAIGQLSYLAPSMPALSDEPWHTKKYGNIRLKTLSSIIE